MIDRKLLKTNRWFDEEYLQARMSNACFNGGGGGDGGADEDEAYEGQAMREYERDYGGYDGAEGQEIERQIAAQAAAQAAAEQQRANEFASAQQAQQEAAQQQAAQRANEFASAQQAQQEAAVQQQRANEFASAQQAQQDAAAAAQVDTFRNMGVNVDTFGGMQDALAAQNVDRFGGMQDALAAQNVDRFGGMQDVLGSRSGLMAASQAQANAQNLANMQGYDPQVTGGFLDPTVSPTSGAYVDVLGSEKGLYDATTANIDAFGAQFGPNHPFNSLTRSEQERAMDRFNAGPSGIANIFGLGDASRMANLANSEIDMRVGPGHPDWDRGDPARDVRPVDQTGNVIGSTVIPPGAVGGGGGVGGFPPWAGGGGYPPGGGGGAWPPGGGGGGYQPGWGGGGVGGGGGYPPTWGAGGRTGGGMPGYMANYPIHSQNLFNFTPARAMPGIDPSYQPWMQPAQGMAQNLWNYQAPNLLPWDMTNRVPWNFATTPTGEYGPMVATVGGQPAEGGNRGDA